jgi:hypothetical protein
MDLYIGQLRANYSNGDVMMWNGAQWVTYNAKEDPTLLERRKKELMEEFDKNPELYNEIVTEMRRKKIERLKK